jgi:hypothetical protein
VLDPGTNEGHHHHLLLLLLLLLLLPHLLPHLLPLLLLLLLLLLQPLLVVLQQVHLNLCVASNRQLILLLLRAEVASLQLPHEVQ